MEASDGNTKVAGDQLIKMGKKRKRNKRTEKLAEPRGGTTTPGGGKGGRTKGRGEKISR